MITLRRKLLVWLWHGLPVLSLLTALLAMQTLTYSASLRFVMPPITMMVVYYWCVKSSTQIPYWLVFTAGMLQDAFISGLMGMSALLWMGLKYLVEQFHEELEESGFMAVWAFFSLILIAFMGLEWGCMAFFLGAVKLPIALPLQYAVSVLAYPAVHKAGSALYQRLYRKVWFMVKVA